MKPIKENVKEFQEANPVKGISSMEAELATCTHDTM